MNLKNNQLESYLNQEQLIPANISIFYQNLHQQQDDFWDQNLEDFNTLLNKKQNLSSFAQKGQQQIDYSNKQERDTADQDQDDTYSNKNNQQGRVRKNKYIQSNLQTIIHRHQIMIGEKDDTVSLNRNLKSIILKFTNQGICLNKYSETQKLIIQQFKDESTASFKLLKKLIEESQQFQQLHQHNLKSSIYQFLSSPKIINYILFSQSFFHQKIRLLKFVQIARKNLQSSKSKIVKWKNNIGISNMETKKSYTKQMTSFTSNQKTIDQKRMQQLQSISAYLQN